MTEPTQNDMLLSASALFVAAFASFVRAVEHAGDLDAAEAALKVALGNYQAAIHHAASVQSAGAVAIVIQMLRQLNEDLIALQAHVKRLEENT